MLPNQFYEDIIIFLHIAKINSESPHVDQHTLLDCLLFGLTSKALCPISALQTKCMFWSNPEDNTRSTIWLWGTWIQPYLAIIFTWPVHVIQSNSSGQPEMPRKWLVRTSGELELSASKSSSHHILSTPLSPLSHVVVAVFLLCCIDVGKLITMLGFAKGKCVCTCCCCGYSVVSGRGKILAGALCESQQRWPFFAYLPKYVDIFTVTLAWE